MNIAKTILMELTGTYTHTFYLVNRHYNPILNTKSKQTLIKKNTDWDLLADSKWSQLNFRDAYFDAKGINRAIRIDIDDGRPFACLEADITAVGIYPSYIMETTKGYHLFFIFNKPEKSEYLQDYEIKLNRSLRGDEKAIGAASWRVPETYSYSNRYHPKFCKVIYQSFQLLDFEKTASLIGALTEQSVMDAIFSDAGYVSSVPDSVKVEPESYRTVYKPRKSGKSEQALRVEKALQGAAEDKRLLISYLGVEVTKGGGCKCPYHKDRKPSAGIFKVKGRWVFKCFSCNLSKDLIALIQEKESRKGRNLVQRILQLSGNGHLVGSNFAKPEIDFSGLNRNLDFISSLSCFTYPTPLLRSLTNEEKSILTFTKGYENFIHFAKTKILLKEMIFPGSLTEIFTASGKTKIEHSSNEVYHLVAMGWIRRLKKFEIPADQLESTRKANAHHKNKEISWWHIPDMTSELLQEVLYTMSKLRKAGITLRNISKKTILEAFGKEMLDRIYIGNSDYREWIEKSREATKDLFNEVDAEYQDKEQGACAPSRPEQSE